MLDKVANPQVQRAFVVLQNLLAFGERQLERGNLLYAAVAAQIAALHASYNHPGEFISPRLERLGQGIAGALADSEQGAPVRRKDGIRQVLHVLTSAKEVGGDSRFVWRWIGRDAARRHSVALTQQLNFVVPQELKAAVAATGGQIHVLDADGADVLTCAARLRRAAAQADMVALHVYPEDIVPLLAFAVAGAMPPVVFVAQADHQFWTGLSISDWVAGLRESGGTLAVSRRAWDADRIALLPIPLEEGPAGDAKTAARQRLGIPQHCKVLLTVARAIKYDPISGPPFAEALVPVLERHPDAMLIAVGPNQAGPWEAAHRRTGGRVLAVGQRSDTADYYRAADIYVDSFPFSSNTSLLEAALNGLPLVTFFPFGDAVVLGAGAPGIDTDMIRCHSLQELQGELEGLLGDAEGARALGARIRARVLHMHAGAGWKGLLENLYARVAETEKRARGLAAEDVSQSLELDVLLHRFYAGSAPLGWNVGWYVRRLPWLRRVAFLARFAKLDRSFSFSLLLPSRLGGWLGRRLSGWRQWPVLGRMVGARQ